MDYPLNRFQSDMQAVRNWDTESADRAAQAVWMEFEALTKENKRLEDLADFIAALWDGLETDLTDSFYIISRNTKARVDGLIAALEGAEK